MTRTLVFDYDGTLMNTKSAYVETLVKAFDAYNIKITAQEVADALIPTIRGTIEEVLAKKGSGENKVLEKLENRTITLLSSEWMDHITPTENITELLDPLYDNGFDMHIVTNSHSSFVLPAISKFRLGKYFREVITLDSGYEDKAAMVNAVAERTGKDVSELIYIADTLLDLEFAEKAGCELILLVTPSSWDYDKRIKLIDTASEKPGVKVVVNIQDAKYYLLKEF